MNYKKLKAQVEEYANYIGVDPDELEVDISLAPLEDETGNIRYYAEISEVIVVDNGIVLSVDGRKDSIA